MSKGRKKKPVAAKKLAGTLRKDRLPENMPVPSQDGMDRAVFSGSDVQKNFLLLHELVKEMGNDSASFGPALSLAAIHMQEISEYSQILENEAVFYESSDGKGKVIKRPHPAIAARHTASQRLQSLLSEFGLTPAAIQKVGSLGTKKGQGAFGEFLP